MVDNDVVLMMCDVWKDGAKLVRVALLPSSPLLS